MPVYKLSHYMEATLSNSNPILHPVRLYVLFKDWTPTKIYTHIPFCMAKTGMMSLLSYGWIVTKSCVK